MAMTCSTGSPAPFSAIEAAEPRKRVTHLGACDLAEQVAVFAEGAGIDLLPWQKTVLSDWSQLTAPLADGGTFVHQRAGGSVPRQAGKSVSGIAWAGFLASILGYKVLWTDHNYSTTCEMLSRFRDMFGRRPADPTAKHKAYNRRVTHVNNKTAQEAFEFKGGGVLAFSTRTKSAALGYSFDVVIYDEAQELTGEQVQAIAPTMSSGSAHNPQSVYLGTPTRAGSPAESFQEVRSDAWAGGDRAADLCWTEYGLDEVGDVADESRWLRANPSLGALANFAAIRMGMRSGMGELAFAQEYLGYWLPKVADAVVSAKEWGKCLAPPPPEDTDMDRVCYGVKFSPDGSMVALAVAGRLERESLPHVELVEYAPASGGTAWLADWLAERARVGACVAIDGLAAADALCDRLAEARVPRGYAVRPRAGDVIAAASLMHEAIRSEQMTHIEQPALDESVTRATRRKIGTRGGWAWGGDASCPIEAASLALWALKTTKRNPKRKQVAW